jgi:hypothetical protein
MGKLQNWQNEINANTGLFKGFSHEHLTRIWNEVIEPWVYPAKGLHDLSAPVAFEYLIIRAFELEGAEVSYPFMAKPFSDSRILEEIDGAIYLPGISAIVESKCFDQKNVSAEQIGQLRNKLINRPSYGIGCFFARTAYQENALKQARMASPQCILLWTGEEIKQAFFAQRLVAVLQEKNKKFFEDLKPN